ncbi:Peptidase S8 and S53 subtilisin kexin sedolisin [Nostocoides japonicum T1-X7]|uniref:Peptidase S8 and S53 subtilisin kexin sedolisin n=1 Tax=Nostocoides japonicum T1-X7 TaxID=1194083 RepID=A0A077LWG8_9MICO|nr:S53 family peptidase [Tetrasphaera japonica]CCH78066.1 Peptidase S8 and S53 subtilisin kexin sedolisin [Tetrasphaera japonica T1-X7]
MTRARTILLSLGAVGAAVLAMAQPASAGAPTATTRPSCSTAGPGEVRCFSEWRSPSSVERSTAQATAKPAGHGPADIASAYRLTGTGGAGVTVAIVDAFDNPRVEKDLATYRATFGLPPCTTAGGCFRKVNQRGGATPPDADPGWGVEIALDVQAVSASCPRCRILLVEADDPSFDNIGKAVNRAVALGADVVSNSYGGDEFTSARTLRTRYYTHRGVAQVASSGDFGFGTAQVPAAFPEMIAVGGTRLARKAGAWKETAWSGAGSGCSAWYAKPTWQQDGHCSMRTVADVSALADGFTVRDTYGLGSDNGWIVVGGTSVAAPLVAGMIGRAGNASTLDSARYIYQHRSGLQDVVGGRNGFCGGDYLCTAVTGYDGPTGLGAPRGLSAL